MCQVMPYASGRSVRRLSKIATLLLAKNYIVMLQRTVDELRRLLVDPAHHHDPSTRTPAGGLPPSNPYDKLKYPTAPTQSPTAHQASMHLNVDHAVQTPDVRGGCLQSPSALPAEVILTMTSLPSAMLNERLISHVSMRRREKISGVLDWSAATVWKPETVTSPDSAAMTSGQFHPRLMAASPSGGLLLPWIDCATPIPLMPAARLHPYNTSSVSNGCSPSGCSLFLVNQHLVSQQRHEKI